MGEPLASAAPPTATAEVELAPSSCAGTCAVVASKPLTAGMEDSAIGCCAGAEECKEKDAGGSSSVGGGGCGSEDGSEAAASADRWCSRPFWRELLAFLGPGFLISMAYIDPGNLSSDINQGVHAGYKLAWVTLWCTAVGYVIQMGSARLSVVTGRHLAEHMRSQYPRGPRLALWALIELAIVACDMIEVIGGAVALSTLSGGQVPLWAGVLVTAASAFAALCLERAGMRALEALLFSLILVIGGTFGYCFFTVGVDYLQVLKGLAVPRVDSGTVQYAVGSIGALIMPHNLYLHSALVLTRAERIRLMSVPRAMRYVRIESGIALSLSLVINVFVVSVFAAAFFGTPLADSIGLGNAGPELAAMFGGYMRYLWGIGLLAAANASTITSTYAGQVVMSGFLGLRISVWWRTALVRLTTLGPTLLVAVFAGRGQDASLGTFTEWLNIVQSLVLPFAIVPLLLVTSSRAVMGEHVNPRWFQAVMGLVAAGLVGLNGYLAVSFCLDELPSSDWALAVFWIVFAAYVAFLGYLLVGPDRSRRWASAVAKFARERVRPSFARAEDMMEVHL